MDLLFPLFLMIHVTESLNFRKPLIFPKTHVRKGEAADSTYRRGLDLQDTFTRSNSRKSHKLQMCKRGNSPVARFASS